MEQYNNCNRNNCGRYVSGQNPNMQYVGSRTMNMTTNEKYKYKYQMPLAFAYVPSQEFEETYDLKKGLCEGTIFPELNYIFCGIRGNR